MNSLDQPGINGFVNIVIKERRLQCGGVPPEFGGNGVTFDRGAQRGGKGVTEFAVGTVHFPERGLADLPVPVFQKGVVISVIQSFSANFSEGQIGIIQGGKSVIRRPGHAGIQADDLFFRFRKYMLASPDDFLQDPAVFRQFRSIQIPGDDLFRQRGKFRHEPGGKRRKFCKKTFDPVLPGPVGGVASIFIRPQMGVNIDFFGQTAERIILLHGFGQYGGTFCESAAISGKFLRKAL